MKYNDNGEWKDIIVKATDTLPIGTEVDYDGTTVPDGWEEIEDEYQKKLTAGDNITIDENNKISATVPTISDTYSATSTNGMSGKAVASAISNIGTVSNIAFSNITVNAGTDVVSITLDPGVWIIVGHAQHQGWSVRWYMSIDDNSCSAYDNSGYVDAMCTVIVSPSSKTTYTMKMWNMDSTGAAVDKVWSGNIRAVRIK